MELIKSRKGCRALTKAEFGLQLNKYIEKNVHSDEVDLVFPAFGDEKMNLELENYLNVMHVFD